MAETLIKVSKLNEHVNCVSSSCSSQRHAISITKKMRWIKMLPVNKVQCHLPNSDKSSLMITGFHNKILADHIINKKNCS